MSSSATLAHDRSRSRTTERRRFGQVAAYLAAPLWALQAVIWLVAPKVQEAAAPYAITSPLLFVLFWGSIAGAIAFSAAAAAEMPRIVQGFGSRVARWARVLAVIALLLAATAVTAIAAAVFPPVQSAALGVMTNVLNAGLLALALSVSLSAFGSWRADRAPRSTSTLVTVVAVVTIALIAAILASGSDSVIALYAAAAVAVGNGLAWLAWARASAGDRHRPPLPA